MIKIVTRILRLFPGLFTRAGVDFNRMLAIVTIKIAIDNRIDRSGKKKETSNGLVWQGIILALCGPIFFISGISTGAYEVSLLSFHSYLLLMLVLSFMMEYSRLLFDQNDNHILRHLPVSSRTILAARLVTMITHMLFLAGCMSAIPLLIIIFWKGLLSGLFFILSMLLNTLFSILLANALYLGVMRFISVEKFQRVMSYVQVILIAGVAMSYQLVGQATRSIHIDMFHPGTWMYFTPPCYFMSLTTMVKQPTPATLIMALTGLTLVALLWYITMNILAPYFSVKMGMLEQYTPVSRKRQGGKERLLFTLSRVFTWGTVQSAGFVLGWRLTRDNLKFRQGILPMIIYTFFLAVFFIYQGIQNEDNGIIQYMPLYMVGMIGIGILMNMSILEKGDLLWIYRSKPLLRPGALILGSFKALYVKYYLPVYILLSGIYIVVLQDWDILPDLFLILGLSTLSSYIYLWFAGLMFPFSKERGTLSSGRNMVRMIVMVIMLFIIGGIHTAASSLSWDSLWCAVVGVWVIVFLIELAICRVSWKRIISNY